MRVYFLLPHFLTSFPYIKICLNREIREIVYNADYCSYRFLGSYNCKKLHYVISAALYCVSSHKLFYIRPVNIIAFQKNLFCRRRSLSKSGKIWAANSTPDFKSKDLLALCFLRAHCIAKSDALRVLSGRLLDSGQYAEHWYNGEVSI